MRSLLLFLGAFVLSSLTLNAQQSEIEPNDSYEQANNWTYGQTMSGSECSPPAFDADYIRIVLPSDGVIHFTVTTQGSGLDPGEMQFALFPKSGFYQQYHTLAGDASPSTISFSHSCLSGDTMYVRMTQADHGNDACIEYEMAYTVSPAVYSNDIGNNNDISTPQAVSLNAPIDGRLDFLYDNSADWYAVTTPTDGTLRIIASSEHADTGSDGAIQIYVAPSNTTFNSPVGALGGAETDTFTVSCLAAQTIPVRIQNTNSGVACGISYRLRFEHIPNLFANDPFPNDDFNDPQPVTLGTAFEGHLSNIGDQTSDFYGFTVPDDGTLRIIMEAEHHGTATDGTVQVYEPISNSYHLFSVGANGIAVTDTFDVHCLHSGTDVIRIQNGNFLVACGVSYHARLSLLPPEFTNDPEPNEGTAEAVYVPADTDRDGHIGHLASSSYDHFKLWKGYAGTMRIIISSSMSGPSSALNVWTLNAGLNENITTGENGEVAVDTVEFYTAAPDTIQLRVASMFACGSYSFRYSGISVGLEDHEPETLAVHARPNPSTSGLFTLRFDGFTPLHVQVSDIGGRAVHEEEAALRVNTLDLDLSDLPDGSYTARFIDPEGRWAHVRLVRAH